MPMPDGLTQELPTVLLVATVPEGLAVKTEGWPDGQTRVARPSTSTD